MAGCVGGCISTKETCHVVILPYWVISLREHFTAKKYQNHDISFAESLVQSSQRSPRVDIEPKPSNWLSF